MASPDRQTDIAAPTRPEENGEVELLRARVAALEAELAEVHSRANAAIAVAQDRAYWLDRWHLDLNGLMRRRGAVEFRAAVRALRFVFRLLKRARRAVAR
jgi:hypothetical protein